MVTGQVREIWHYPVKSMMGGRLDSADVGTDGIPGDREYAMRDEQREAIQGARRHGALMQCSAVFRAGEFVPGGDNPVDITFPDGTVIGTDDPALNEAVSELVGTEMTIWPLMPKSDRKHYRRERQTPWEAVRDLSNLLGVQRGEHLPNVLRLPKTLMRNETLPGTYFDAAPIMVLTTQSLAALADRLPDAHLDVRRFRPNLLVDLGDDAPPASGKNPGPEQAWIGKKVQVGDVELKVISNCPRCVMPTRPFDDLPEDRRILRTIAKEFGRDFGVYATVTRPGRVAVGDRLTVG